jgi:hypothetical protein
MAERAELPLTRIRKRDALPDSCIAEGHREEAVETGRAPEAREGPEAVPVRAGA